MMAIADYLLASPTAFTLVSAILGLLVGSFLNVVIHRLPKILEREWQAQCAELLEQTAPSATLPTFNLVTPRSRCPECGHGITAVENIPLISYLALRGRCRKCGSRISPRYPAVELLCGLLTGAVAWKFGFGLAAGGAMMLTWALIALSFIDFEHTLLPDNITLPFLWVGIGFNFFNVFTSLESAVLGAVAGYLCLWSVYHAFKLVTGKEGMGYGDFKLLAMLGAWLGWQVLPVIILMSSMVGACVGVGLIALRSHDRDIPIPFGPYLAVAGWIAMLWGYDLIAWYLG
jgi:leader peptidase (prepilin peptidase)/N-methyltransferase